MGKKRPSRYHGVLIVDKPKGPTSHDVVSKARRVFETRSVGHAGTLDPMATGVLVLGVGEGTKMLRWLTADDKSYVATLKLGVGTDTLDAEGAVVERATVPHLSKALVDSACSTFEGTIVQTPPRFSAIKVDGVRLHERARRGEDIEVPERTVRVHHLTALTVRADEIDFEVTCSKGFYVRSLGRDLALALGSCGHLTALRRTSSGAFSLADTCSGVRLFEGASGDGTACEAVLGKLLSLREAGRGMPGVMLNCQGVEDAFQGRPVRLSGLMEAEMEEHAFCDGPTMLLDETGDVVAVAQWCTDHFQVLRGIRLPTLSC